LAHTGSASIESGLRAGGFPSKVTVPFTVEAATAMPGHNDTATIPAATHNRFEDTRTLALIIANLVSAVIVFAAFRPP
jgi:hypothetical protein